MSIFNQQQINFQNEKYEKLKYQKMNFETYFRYKLIFDILIIDRYSLYILQYSVSV